MLCQRVELLIPRLLEYGCANLIRSGAPPQGFTWKIEPLNQPHPAIQRHLAEGRRVGERPADRAHFPDALIRVAPLTRSGFDQSAQLTPQPGINLAMMRSPLIGTIEYLTIDVVLNLLHRRVAPAHRARAAIARQLHIRSLRRRKFAVEVVQHSRASTTFNRIKHPAEKS